MAEKLKIAQTSLKAPGRLFTQCKLMVIALHQLILYVSQYLVLWLVARNTYSNKALKLRWNTPMVFVPYHTEQYSSRYLH